MILNLAFCRLEKVVFFPDRVHKDKCSVAEIQVGQGGNRPPPPPSVNRHILSEIFGFFGIFKTIEYTGINKNNYWCGRQLICTERRFDYLEAICLI